MPNKNNKKTNNNKASNSKANNNKANNNKANNNKENQFSKSDMDFLDQCIAENKQLAELNKNANSNEKSPLEQNLDKLNNLEKKKKLRAAINMKQQMRGMVSKKEIDTQEKLLKEMMQHPKMSNEILHLYGKAIEYNPTKTLPNPVEIFDNDEKYRVEYYQYILSIIDSFKEQKKDIKFLNKVLDNPYGHYMSKCLNCPLNPFDKTNKTNKTSKQINSTISEMPKTNVKLNNEMSKDYDDISDDENSDNDN